MVDFSIREKHWHFITRITTCFSLHSLYKSKNYSQLICVGWYEEVFYDAEVLLQKVNIKIIRLLNERASFLYYQRYWRSLSKHKILTYLLRSNTLMDRILISTLAKLEFPKHSCKDFNLIWCLLEKSNLVK